MNNIKDQTSSGISKYVHSARKQYKCDFCGGYIWENEPYICTIDFIEHRVVRSCDKCGHGIIALYGD